MVLKRLIPVIALALAFLPLLSAAKSYDITLDSPTIVGTLQLAAGQYSLKVDGGNAVFTNTNTGKKFIAPVKVTEGEKRFSDTVVETTSSGGTAHVIAISLGGSNTQLVFD